MAPICTLIEDTLEDKSVTDPEERYRLYGLFDHVRLYSRSGYLRVLKAGGFTVKMYDEKFFGKTLFKNFGLKPTSVLYIVSK